MNTNNRSDNQSQTANGISLITLLQGLEYSILSRGSDDECSVNDVSCDSRNIGNGSLFVAVSGVVTDGHKFVESAALKGCSVIVVEKGREWRIPDTWGGIIVESDDTRFAYAKIAENFYSNPAAEATLIGISGTNGKTTISYLIEDILENLGFRVGVIGTVNYRYQTGTEKIVQPSPFTTPEPMQLQKLLREMVDAGVQYIVMEVSSHALDQHRIGTLKYDVAAFTNLSRDHLDYHLTMEEYFDAKTKLFADHLKTGGNAVISTPQIPGEQIDWSGRLKAFCLERNVEVLECGKQDTAATQIIRYNSTLKQTELVLNDGGKEFKFQTPLVGHFNVDNLTTAITVSRALGLKFEDIVEASLNSKGAPGRLQRVEVNDGTEFGQPVVFVDYAHTPDALQQVLNTVAALPHNDLFCVFGCGGDRDSGKRPVMGEFAGTIADVAVVTDDNPRTEDPHSIRAEIIPGVLRSGKEQRPVSWLKSRSKGDTGFVEIGSRAEAIHAAVRAARPGDIILIAGKGHEKYQLSLQGKRFFDDCLEAEETLLNWNCDAIALATGGKLSSAAGCSALLNGVSTDSRSITSGDIFVPLKGERFDGHAFLADVEEKGAGCLLAEIGTVETGKFSTPVVEVEDTLKALGDLAHFRRQLLRKYYEQKIIGITGSCGKTTVKEMTGSILRRKWQPGPDYPENAVLQTQGNLNNLIGLPLSLLPLGAHHKAAVLEMGMNAPGEIKAMASIAQPDVCCITNVHGVHLEGLQSIEGVAKAKAELFDEASADSTLVINLDDPHVSKMVPAYKQKQVTFATDRASNPEADLWVTDVECAEEGVITFTLHHGDLEEQVHLYTVGLHNVTNALCSAAIATAVGATLQEVAAGLADFRPADRRMVQLKTERGVGVLNDTYNANPASMAAGLNTLVSLGGKNCAAVLGDMLELGSGSEEAHRELGKLVAELGVTYLCAVGKFKDKIEEGALLNNMNKECVKSFATKDDAASWIEKLQDDEKLQQDDWILVKASRGLRMETIVERLTGKS